MSIWEKGDGQMLSCRMRQTLVHLDTGLLAFSHEWLAGSMGTPVESVDLRLVPGIYTTGRPTARPTTGPTSGPTRSTRVYEITGVGENANRFAFHIERHDITSLRITPVDTE